MALYPPEKDNDSLMAFSASRIEPAIRSGCKSQYFKKG